MFYMWSNNRFNMDNICIYCKKCFDNAMELWNHSMGAWCGEWPDFLKMNIYDFEKMKNVDILIPVEKNYSWMLKVCFKKI